jgi:hypothetical protein
LSARSAKPYILVAFLHLFLVCIKHNVSKLYLAEISKPEKGTFILVESLIHEKNTSRIVNVILPDATRDKFKLGRGHEADIRITDISVSRFHATLICKREGYYIEDNKSKFGTLAYVQKIEMNPSLARAVQVGRTSIGLMVKSLEVEQ